MRSMFTNIFGFIDASISFNSVFLFYISDSSIATKSSLMSHLPSEQFITQFHKGTAQNGLLRKRKFSSQIYQIKNVRFTSLWLGRIKMIQS